MNSQNFAAPRTSIADLSIVSILAMVVVMAASTLVTPELKTVGARSAPTSLVQAAELGRRG